MIQFTKSAGVSYLDTFSFEIDPKVEITPLPDLSLTDTFDFSTIEVSAFDLPDLEPVDPSLLGVSSFASASSSGTGFSSVSVSASAGVSNDGRAFTTFEAETVGNATLDFDVNAIGFDLF
jgi:hypothetical protein